MQMQICKSKVQRTWTSSSSQRCARRSISACDSRPAARARLSAASSSPFLRASASPSACRGKDLLVVRFRLFCLDWGVLEQGVQRPMASFVLTKTSDLKGAFHRMLRWRQCSCTQDSFNPSLLVESRAGLASHSARTCSAATSAWLSARRPAELSVPRAAAFAAPRKASRSSCAKDQGSAVSDVCI